MIEIPHPLASAASARPDHLALVAPEGTLTARALARAAAYRAASLAASGVEPGSVVALCGPASLDWAVSFHAIGWLGATVAPLGTQSTTSEIEAAARVLAPTHALVTNDLSPEITERLAVILGEHLLRPDDAAAPSAERFWPLAERRVVVLTSGTTGTPRPVVLTTAQLVFSAFGSALRLGHLPDDRWLACLPLHHVGGLSILVRCALYGTTVQLERGFDPERVGRLIDEGVVSLVSLVPTMLARLLDIRGDRPFPPTLRALLVGGAPTPPALVARCRALGAPLALTWGMSETASQVATGFVGEAEPEGAVGPPLAFARVDVADGRLRVRGPLAPAGEIVTADCGWIDTEGRVHPTARADDVIISGGEKITPAEVEAVLRRHPAIAEAAVVAVPDERWGERPIALCVAGPGAAPASDAEIRVHCRGLLAPSKTPDRFLWVTQLARNDLGKLSRAVLRAEVSRILADEQARTPERGGELARELARSAARAVDTDMHEHHAGAQGVVLAPQLVDEAHRAVACLREEHLYPQPLPETDRAHEVSLGVDDRQRPRSASKEAVDGPQPGGDELLEGGMAVLEDAAKKKDTGAIDLEEARRDAMLEGHGFPREEPSERSGDARS